MKTTRKFGLIALAAVGALLTLGAAAYAVGPGSAERTMTGVVVAPSNIALDVPAQPGVVGVLRVARVTVPGSSWIVVHLDDNGKPGMRIGLQHVPAGTSSDVNVRLEGSVLSDELIVAVHADRGVTGNFEFAMDRFESSSDKPYFVNGKEMATRVRVR